MKEMFFKGGPLMYVILGFSIVALAVVINRFFYFFLAEKGDKRKLREQLKEYIKKDDISAAKALCTVTNNSISKIIAVILENYKLSKELLEEKVEEVAMEQVSILERYVWILKLTGDSNAVTRTTRNGYRNDQSIQCNRCQRCG